MDTTAPLRRPYRAWPESLKREIVAAASAPGASVSAVARQYGVNANMVFMWRRRFGEATAAAAPKLLVPVVMTPSPSITTPPPYPAPDTIEIERPCGTRIRVGRDVTAAALRALLDKVQTASVLPWQDAASAMVEEHRALWLAKQTGDEGAKLAAAIFEQTERLFSAAE
jgi:transposase